MIGEEEGVGERIVYVPDGSGIECVAGALRAPDRAIQFPAPLSFRL